MPCTQLGYQELQFTLAEAANRGWINESAANYYTNGILADMEFYGVSQQESDEFIQGPEIVFQGEGIKKGFQIQESTMAYDIAGTIAYICGIEQPQVWIARPIKTMFEE